MASPFRIFRKYQKALLVGAGVILMFVFVIGDALVGYLGGSGGGGAPDMRELNATAVEWDGGSLSNADVSQLVAKRQLTNTFLRSIEELGVQSALMAGVEPRPLRVRPLYGPQTAEQGVERDVVLKKMFADAARDSGMSVSDEAVIQYLHEFGRGKVTNDDMRAIVEHLGKNFNYRVSSDFVIDAVRDEMLAQNYIASHLYAFQTMTPQERWTDWLRANDRIVVEAAALPVEQYLIDVKDPTDAELTAFYDEWKEREASPDLVAGIEMPSARPGFRVPRKIDVQYITANFDEVRDKVEGEITDEEIEKYYNENKDQFVKAADPALLDALDALQDSTSEETNKEELAPSATTDSPESGQSTNEAPPATETDAAPATKTEGAQTPPATESQPADDQPAAPAEGDQSSRERASAKSPFRLAAFLQENETAQNATESSNETAPATSTETPASSDAPATETPAAPAVESSATPSTGSSPLLGGEGQGEGGNPAAASTTDPAPEKPKEYQPLEEVKDVIRRRLAEDRVHEQLSKKMDEVYSALDAEYTKYIGLKLDADAQKLAAPAAPAAIADLKPLAEKHGFTVTKTGPMPWLELRNAPVGKSGNASYTMPLSSILFGTRELELYEPVQTMDIDGNQYLAVKMSDVEGRVPELKEVRDEVVKAYKRQKAAEIALKDAEAQAKKAQESRSSLTDFFAEKPNVKVVKTDPFSQLTAGDAPDQFGRQPLRFSQPEAIVAPGLDFLRKVFELKDGEVAAVLNNDQSIAYVVRVAEHLNSQEELRNAYLAEANTWNGLPALMNEHAQIARQMLFDDVIEQANLKWVRDPDPRQQDDVID
jgi:hypothetical protein